MQDLIAKHKKQNKELQAKITGLKKSIQSGASKKKQILEEIELLSRELKLSQEKELKELEESDSIPLESLSLNSNNGLELESSNLKDQEKQQDPTGSIKEKKPNRQEKRKQKKAQQMESLRREAELEASMSVNTKELEDASLSSILSPLGLAIHAINADGHCLYSSISHQLDGTLNYKRIRKIASEYLMSHPDDFMPFMVNASGESMSSSEYQEYCKDVSDSSTWGGQIELQALAMSLDCVIHVYQADTPLLVIGNSQDLQKQTLLLSYHKHSYGLGEHYNSLIKNK